MTQLNTLLPESTFGDLMTVFTDYTAPGATSGFTNVLKNIQDGFGKDSILQISLTQFNINRSGGNFLLDNVALTADPTKLNSLSTNSSIGVNFNTFIGVSCGTNITSGVHNSGFGGACFQHITSGNLNCAMGSLSLNSMTVSSSVSAFGASCLSDLTAGDGNSALGFSAGTGVQIATNCLFLGLQASASAQGLTNAVAIGATSRVGIDNAINLGNGCFVGINNPSPVATLDIAPVDEYCTLQMKNSEIPEPPASGCGVLYVSGGNLFYVDSLGNRTQLN